MKRLVLGLAMAPPRRRGWPVSRACWRDSGLRSCEPDRVPPGARRRVRSLDRNEGDIFLRRRRTISPADRGRSPGGRLLLGRHGEDGRPRKGRARAIRRSEGVPVQRPGRGRAVALGDQDRFGQRPRRTPENCPRRSRRRSGRRLRQEMADLGGRLGRRREKRHPDARRSRSPCGRRGWRRPGRDRLPHGCRNRQQTSASPTWLLDGPRITYSLAPLAASRNAAAAARFVSLLDSPAGRAVFERRGFIVPLAP